jgi:MFS family permease
MAAKFSGFHALLITQALSAFNHNMLRSALLTLIAFRPIERAGMSPETLVALSTLFMVAPYAVLSILGGRLADTVPKSLIIRRVKAAEIAIFGLSAAGLILMNAPLLLAALLLAGIQAALFGPAKFGILPELLERSRLVAGNAWMSATNTLAILAGLIAGNLLVLSSGGPIAVAAGGILLAFAGWLLARRIPLGRDVQPGPAFTAAMILMDFRTCFARMGAVPAVIFPIIGCSWFWFQGAVNTSLMPLYVAQTPSAPESIVSLLLVASSIGVAVGAIAARSLAGRGAPAWLPVVVFAVTVLPGIDLWIAGPLTDIWSSLRAAGDFLLLASGCGFYLVPLTTAVQQLTPDAERARFIAVNHTVNGIAMMAAGLVVLLLHLPFVSTTGIFAWTTLFSGAIAVAALLYTVPSIIPNAKNAS